MAEFIQDVEGNKVVLVGVPGDPDADVVVGIVDRAEVGAEVVRVRRRLPRR